jgi:hypothetical protein
MSRDSLHGLLDDLSDEDVLAPDGASPAADAAAPTPATPAPDAESDPAESVDAAGQPRDASGRFAPKSAPPAPTADGGAAPAVPTTAQPLVPSPETAADPAPMPPTPFGVRAAGKEHALDWVTLTPTGDAVIPAAKLAEFRQLASEAITARTVGREERVKAHQTIKALQQRVQQQSAEQQTAAKLMQALVESPEDQAWDALAQFRAGWPELQLQMERERSQRYEQALKTGQMPPDLAAYESAADASPPDAATQTEALTAAVQEAKQFVPGAETLTDADWQVIQQQAQWFGDALFRKLTEQESQEYGMEAGQYVFDGPRYAKLVSQRVTERQQMQADAQRQAKAAADAAAKNARSTGAGVKTPPTSAPKGAPVAPAQAQRPTDRKSWSESLDKITLE